MPTLEQTVEALNAIKKQIRNGAEKLEAEIFTKVQEIMSECVGCKAVNLRCNRDDLTRATLYYDSEDDFFNYEKNGKGTPFQQEAQERFDEFFDWVGAEIIEACYGDEFDVEFYSESPHRTN